MFYYVSPCFISLSRLILPPPRQAMPHCKQGPNGRGPGTRVRGQVELGNLPCYIRRRRLSDKCDLHGRTGVFNWSNRRETRLTDFISGPVRLGKVPNTTTIQWLIRRCPPRWMHVLYESPRTGPVRVVQRAVLLVARMAPASTMSTIL